MIVKSHWCVSVLSLTLVACGDSSGGDIDNDAAVDDDAGRQLIAAGTSKGGSAAVNDAANTLAVANKATNDVSLFELPSLGLRARIEVGDEPVSVTWSPDSSTLFVVNRRSQSVSVVTGAETAAPAVASTIAVGAEPGHGALSPTGKTLYVANWAEGTISVIDTATASVTQSIQVGGAPLALCMTNDGDDDDTDETLFAPDFYSRAIDGEKAGTDRSRKARVFRIDTGDLSVQTTTLSALDVTGIEPAIDAANTGAFPNQLYSCVVNGDDVYVTSVNASPEAFNNTTDFRQNIHGAVYVIDATSGEVDSDRTVNLSELVTALAAPKRFIGVPSDIDCVENTDICYMSSLNSNAVFRVDFAQRPPLGGSPGRGAFLAAGASPTGIAISSGMAYTYNEVGRSVSEIDLTSQITLQTDVEAAPQPTAQAEIEALRGQKFFNTGLARWSANGWVGCVGCHPFGTTDNVTYSFPAGPRQTVDTSATFNAGGSVHRILNWSAIFDEACDFELNTRGVANGTGAIVADAGLNDDGSPNVGARIDFVGPGGVGDPANGFNVGSACAVARGGAVPDDWDDINTYLQSIRSPRGATAPAGDPVAGREVFLAGKCESCHGGPLWTLSERYFTPLLDGDLRLVTLADAGVTDVDSVRADLTPIVDPATTALLEIDGNGPPHRHVCVVRKVGTFDNAGPANRGADELRQNGGAAQGIDGFNVPSLLGINMGAPYLHNGAAETLDELLDPGGSFQAHLRAGNAVFAPNATDVANLIAFLQTIDDSTEIIDVPAGQNICPTNVSPPTP